MRIRMVVGLGISQILGWGATFYMPAVLAHPMSRDTGWSVSAIVAGLSLGLLVAGLGSPFVGRWIDRRGGRTVMATASVLLAAGILMVSVSTALWAYYASWIVLGLGMAAGLYDAAFATMGRMLGKEARSSMSGLTLVGGFASTLCWPILAAAETHMGWRHTLQCLAALHLVLCVPIHLMCIPKLMSEADAVKPTVDTTGKPADPTPVQEPSVPGPWVFALVGAIFTLQALVTSSMAVHLIPALQQIGFATATALAVGVLLGPAQIGARLVEMMFGRQVHPTWTFRVTSTCVLIGVAMMACGHTWLAFAAMLLYGGGNGVLTIVKGSLPLSLFGVKGYATRMGILARPVMLAHACGPVIGALVLDTWGGAALLWSLSTVLLLVVLGGWYLPTPHKKGNVTP